MDAQRAEDPVAPSDPGPGGGRGGVDETGLQAAAMEVLTPVQCWDLLGRAEIGRLAVAVAGDVEIFPVTFVVDDGSVVFRTAEGTKLVEIVMAGRVAFEVDGYQPADGKAWSVVVKAWAEPLDRFDDIYRAQELPLVPWHSGPKERFVRLRPDRLTGRRFTVRRT